MISFSTNPASVDAENRPSPLLQMQFEVSDLGSEHLIFLDRVVWELRRARAHSKILKEAELRATVAPPCNGGGNYSFVYGMPTSHFFRQWKAILRIRRDEPYLN